MRGTAFRNCKWNPIQWFWSNSSWCNQWLALRENFNEIQGCFFRIFILTWTFKHFQSLALHCWNNIVRACTLSARILCVKIWRGYYKGCYSVSVVQYDNIYAESIHRLCGMVRSFSVPIDLRFFPCGLTRKQGASLFRSERVPLDQCYSPVFVEINICV